MKERKKEKSHPGLDFPTTKANTKRNKQGNKQQTTM